MVQLKYKGQNYVVFGRTRINTGMNEIPDAEFYRLMKSPLFSSRVQSGVFQVPEGFPLEQPKPAKKVEKEASKDEGHEDDEQEEEGSDRLSVKQTLKVIRDSEDADYLQGLIDKDDRQKVKDAAQKRLESLDSSDKK